MSYTDTISPAQRSFIESLLSERLGSLGVTTVDEAVARMNLDQVTKRDASTLINRLKDMPKDVDPGVPTVVAQSSRWAKGNRPGLCHGCKHPVPNMAGYYFLLPSGQWSVHHVLGECSTEPAPVVKQVEKGLYVHDGQVILVYRTGTGRLAGKVLRGKSFQYQQGAVNLAAMGRVLTAEEAAAHGHATGACIACARDLTDERSTAVGYGPVCATKYGWPWG